MAEKAQTGQGANGDAPAGVPFYEKQRQHLKELLARRRQLEKTLAQHEETIYQKETEYLESTPSGNIIVGFENYTKGVTSAAAQRRKMGQTETNRVFSRSSISYNSNADAAATPGSATSAAPTPLSTSFANNTKDGGGSGSNQATPTSATAGPRGAAKNKKKGAAAAMAAATGGPEDSETDSKDSKKVRTNFGANRK